jgi:hypothetical protein
VNRAVRLERHGGPDALPDGRAPIGLEAHQVRRRHADSREEWHPVVVEVGEVGRDLDGPDLDPGETRRPEQLGQRPRRADRETRSLVGLDGGGIELDRGVEEPPDQLHSIGVVPEIGPDRATVARDATHLLDRPIRIGDEHEHETRYRSPDRTIVEREVHRRTDPERGPRIVDVTGGVLDERRRRVDPDDRPWLRLAHDRVGQRARAAPDIGPVRSRRDGEPVDERLRDGPAPAPDVALVLVAARPHDGPGHWPVP